MSSPFDIESGQIVVESDYEPSEKAQLFHGSNARVIVLVGGLGSGKSYSVVKELEMSALQWPGIPMAMYRKTMPALRDSTLHEFKESSDPRLGEMKVREDTWHYHNGSFLRFRGLDEETKAKSTNYALIVLEEAEEFTFDEFRRLNERVRKVGDWPLRIILVLNPVDEDHWIYKQFVDNAQQWQDSGGLLVLHFSTYDNLKNLPKGYIEQVTVGMSPEEIDRYIHGNWGTIVKGKPVYTDILRPDIHIWTMPRFPGQILLRGWDFGYNHPACSFRLVDEFGRMNCAHSMLGERIDLDEFAPKVLAETERRFGRDIVLHDFGDPRGHDKSPSGKETCFQVLSSLGINAVGERGSLEYVEKGIKENRKDFSTLIHGIPKLTIDPKNTLLRTAYFGKYVRGDDGKPYKDGFYEHIADADRYIPHNRSQNDAVKKAMQDRRDREKYRLVRRNQYTGYSRG